MRSVYDERRKGKAACGKCGHAKQHHRTMEELTAMAALKDESKNKSAIAKASFCRFQNCKCEGFAQGEI